MMMKTLNSLAIGDQVTARIAGVDCTLDVVETTKLTFAARRPGFQYGIYTFYVGTGRPTTRGLRAGVGNARCAGQA